MRHLPTYPYFLILCALYFLLPTQNAQIDSWYYASCVKHQEQLLNSHHLFYTYFGLAFYTLSKIIYSNIEAMTSLFILNALFASLSLIYFYKLLKILGSSKDKALALTLFCGSCFGFFRFATDAETYIIPLFFSIVSSYLYFKSDRWKDLILSSLFATLSVLTHQVHIWWTLALTIHLIAFRKTALSHKLAYLLILLLIPAAYIVSFYGLQSQQTEFWKFILGEYSNGKAGLDLSPMALFLTGANMVRSFVQIHGNIALLLQGYPFLYAICFSVMVYLFFHFYKKNRFNFNLGKRMDQDKRYLVFLLAFVLHLLFAFVSSGNAEFMVMLPFLLIAFLATRYNFNSLSPVILLSVMVFTWNVALGIIPNHFLDFTNTRTQERITFQNPRHNLYWKDKPLIENKLCYLYGFNRKYNFVSADTARNLLERDAWIITDYLNASGPISRKNLIQDPDDEWLRAYKYTPIDSFENFYGKNYIYLMSKP